MIAFEIVQAVPDDAQDIGRLRAHNWEEQYANLPEVTTEWMEAEIERITGPEGTQNRAHWIEQAARPDAASYWIVAKEAGCQALAGFLEARRQSASRQELHSLHIADGWRGKGVGQALMDTASSKWLDPAVDTFLDVAAPNIAGQRFYQRPSNGYEFTERRFFYGPIPMREMVRKATR